MDRSLSGRGRARVRQAFSDLIGWLNDVEAIRHAARITAREARAVGVNWIYAPVADVDLEPDNPIIGTRAFGGDVAKVARDVAVWIEACQAEGVLACAKHFQI